MEFESLVCYSQLLILRVIAVAYLYHYRPGPHAKGTFSVIACGLLLFIDALLLPAGGGLQLSAYLGLRPSVIDTTQVGGRPTSSRPRTRCATSRRGSAAWRS